MSTINPATSRDAWAVTVAGITVTGELKRYQTYTELLTDQNPGRLGWVWDATEDDTVHGGSALYSFNQTTKTWIKVYETEVMDASDPARCRGWFSTPEELVDVPSGNGAYAIIGSTDSIWVWDSETSMWKDSAVVTQRSVISEDDVIILQPGKVIYHITRGRGCAILLDPSQLSEELLTFTLLIDVPEYNWIYFRSIDGVDIGIDPVESTGHTVMVDASVIYRNKIWQQSIQHLRPWNADMVKPVTALDLREVYPTNVIKLNSLEVQPALYFAGMDMFDRSGNDYHPVYTANVLFDGPRTNANSLAFTAVVFDPSKYGCLEFPVGSVPASNTGVTLHFGSLTLYKAVANRQHKQILWTIYDPNDTPVMRCYFVEGEPMGAPMSLEYYHNGGWVRLNAQRSPLHMITNYTLCFNYLADKVTLTVYTQSNGDTPDQSFLFDDMPASLRLHGRIAFGNRGLHAISERDHITLARFLTLDHPIQRTEMAYLQTTLGSLAYSPDESAINSPQPVGPIN